MRYQVDAASVARMAQAAPISLPMRPPNLARGRQFLMLRVKRRIKANVAATSRGENPFSKRF
jgi:hypothetical protein